MTIVASPPTPTIATARALELSIYVPNAAWEQQFDALEVWRSRLGAGGPYTALTGDGWLPASMPSPASVPDFDDEAPKATLEGKTLSLLVNERTHLDILLPGPDPTSFSDVADQVYAQSNNLLRAFVLKGKLYIQTFQPGAAATLRVVGGDAAPLLSLPTKEPLSVVTGTDARVPLIHGVQNYKFTDLNGSQDFFYKTRFYNTLTGKTSEYSPVFQGQSITGVGSDKLVRATLDLVNSNGVSIANTPILLYHRFSGLQPDGKTMIGGQNNGLTDKNGHFETVLVRGMRLTLAIGGTNLARDILVPIDPTIDSFDMLDPAHGGNDLFDVAVPDLQYAVRRSL